MRPEDAEFIATTILFPMRGHRPSGLGQTTVTGDPTLCSDARCAPIYMSIRRPADFCSGVSDMGRRRNADVPSVAIQRDEADLRGLGRPVFLPIYVIAADLDHGRNIKSMLRSGMLPTCWFDAV